MSWLVPRLADVIFLVVFLAALQSGAVMVSVDGDTARHLVVGEYILANGLFPREDLFSHTMAGKPFVAMEWLSEVVSALSYRWAGPAGPVLLHGALIGLAVVVLLGHLQGRGHPPLLAVGVVALAVSASTIHWLARPHIFTLVGTAAFAAVLDAWYRGRLPNRVLWALPVGMLVWANFHGGFLVGLVVVAIYLGAGGLAVATAPSVADRNEQWARFRPLLPVAGALLVAPLATPSGPALPIFIASSRNLFLINRTEEYLSPNFHQPALVPFLIMLLGLFAVMVVSRRRPSVPEAMLFVVFAAFALYAARNVPLFAIVAAPALAAQLEAVAPPQGWLGRALAPAGRWVRARNLRVSMVEASLPRYTWSAAIVGGAAAVATIQWHAGAAPLGIGFDPTIQPVAAVEFLKTHPPAGNGFNQLRWGGYLIHELWPTQRVFIDGTIGFYGEPLMREYLQVMDLGESWQSILDRRGIQWVIYDSDSALVRQLAATPGWIVVYQDDMATVLIRAPPRPPRQSP
jgi:hypothetical protein